jgi:small GTP-binding protein
MFSEKELNEKFNSEYSKLEKEIDKPNILIIGGTGVGKSSLINKIFGEEISKVSNVKPETRGVNTYNHNDVVLLDTEGFELGDDKNKFFEEKIINEVENRKKGPEKNQIHLIWHLISASSERITDYDVNLLNKLQSFGLPIAVVFTKSDIANEEAMDNMVKRLFPKLTFNDAFKNKEKSPFFVSSTEDEDESLSPINLINWSIEKLPEGLKYAFTASQILNYEAKFNQAKSIINQHTLGNSSVGFSPIPFSDAPILIASQIGMITRIIKLYNLSELNIDSFMASTGAGLVVSNLAKSVVGSVFKFIPGIGTVVGGIINALVAGTITFSMGTALNILLRKITIEYLKGDIEKVASSLSNFSELFKNQFGEEFKKKYSK